MSYFLIVLLYIGKYTLANENYNNYRKTIQKLVDTLKEA